MPGPVRIDVLLFDMDGVLMDVSRSYRRAIEETATHFTGREIEPGTVQRYKNQGGFNDDWKLTHAIIGDIGMQVSFGRVVDEFQRRYRGENWDGFIQEERPLIENETLQQLAANGRVMGIVTGRPEAEARWSIAHSEWGRYFPLVVAKEDQESRPKPDPYPIRRACTILEAAGRRVNPKTCAYVGDTVDDIVAARAAGVWAIGFVPPYLDFEEHGALLRQKGAHVVINDLTRLPELAEAFAPDAAAEPIGG
jgi:HAD superfamily phosphatase